MNRLAKLRKSLKDAYGRPEFGLISRSANDPQESGDRMANPVKIKQTAVGSEQVLAPLDTKMSQVENVFGPACIVNESDKRVDLRNDLLSIVLQPGSRHICEGPPLKRWYDQEARTNMIEKWDPLNTLQDLICEYERSQDPAVRYNWSKQALLEVSQLKAFRVRGQV